MIDATAFDGVAGVYDDTFTRTPLGRLLRRRVWHLLERQIAPGQRVLELACGTGEDALWLAERGVQVLATDGSAAMVQLTSQKARQAGLEQAISARHCSLQQLSSGLPAGAADLDGVFSNFGGLNTIGDWQPLARSLAGAIRPGGWLLLVVMGPLCPWETGWHLLHGQWRQAARRWRAPAEAMVGTHTIPVWYPSPRHLARQFKPWFHRQHLWSLGLWLPPSYLGHFVTRAPRLFAWLNRLEQATGRLAGGWGDHYILLLKRGNDGAKPESGNYSL